MTPRRSLAAAVLDDKIYAVGGANKNSPQMDLVEVFDPAMRRWVAVPPLQQARSQHVVIAVDKQLWVLGGWSATEGLISSVERWAPGEPAWTVVSNLPTPRRQAAAAMLGRRLVVVGGFHGLDESDSEGYTDLVEAYDLDNQRWQRLPRLPTPRRGLALTNVAGTLYALGGYAAEEGYLALAERYDPKLNRWVSLNWPILGRASAAVAVFHEVIYVMGGYNEDGHLAWVERINPITGAVCHPTPLRTARSSLAAVALANGVMALGGESELGYENAVEWIGTTCLKEGIV